MPPLPALVKDFKANTSALSTSFLYLLQAPRLNGNFVIRLSSFIYTSVSFCDVFVSHGSFQAGQPAKLHLYLAAALTVD